MYRDAGPSKHGSPDLAYVSNLVVGQLQVPDTLTRFIQGGYIEAPSGIAGIRTFVLSWDDVREKEGVQSHK